MKMQQVSLFSSFEIRCFQIHVVLVAVFNLITFTCHPKSQTSNIVVSSSLRTEKLVQVILYLLDCVLSVLLLLLCFIKTCKWNCFSEIQAFLNLSQTFAHENAGSFDVSSAESHCVQFNFSGYAFQPDHFHLAAQVSNLRWLDNLFALERISSAIDPKSSQIFTKTMINFSVCKTRRSKFGKKVLMKFM